MADEAGSTSPENRLRQESRFVIRRARDRLKMSQDEFARELSKFLRRPMSQSQISDWERGRFEPSASILLAVAEMAGLSVDELRATGPASMIERLEHLENEIDRLIRPEGEAADVQELKAQVQELRQQHGAFYAEVVQAFTRAGVPFGSNLAARRERPSDQKTVDERGG